MDMLNELTKAHLANLKSLMENSQNLKCDRLKEHFEYMHNSMDEIEMTKFEKEKSKKIRVNENLINESEKKTKNFYINWNLEYCDMCMLSYWPSNCKVYIFPKFGVSRASAKMYAKHKLFNFTPKYKSFKEKLLKNIMNRSMRLIYECKTCKSRNLIVKELNHVHPKVIRLDRNKTKTISTKLDAKRTNNKQLTKTLNIVNTKTSFASKVDLSKKPVIPSIESIKARDKKFKSLQAKLKHNEMQQEIVKNEKKTSFGSLADFLQKLT